MIISIIIFVFLTILYTTVSVGAIKQYPKIKKMDNASQATSYIYIATTVCTSLTILTLNYGFFFVAETHKMAAMPTLVVLWTSFSTFVAFSLLLSNTFYESYLLYKTKGRLP